MTELAAGDIPLSKATQEELKPELILESPIARRLKQGRRILSFVAELSTKEIIDIASARLSDKERQISLTNPKLRHQFSLTAAKSDLSAFAEVITTDAYRLTPEIDNSINGKKIVDIGANIGASSTLFASRYDQSTVLSFEPNPRNFSLLAANTQCYLDQIGIREEALSFQAEPVALANGEVKDRGGYSLYRYANEGIESASEFAKPVTPTEIAEQLDDVETIGLLKIDIEGAETQIFRSGAMDILLKKTGVMVIETHDFAKPESSQTVYAAAVSSGMRLFAREKSVLFFRR